MSDVREDKSIFERHQQQRAAILEKDIDQQMEFDEAKSDMYLEDLQQMVNDAKNIKLNTNFESPIIEMNLKLREDLTKAFECYISLLAKSDKLQKDKIQLKFELSKLKEESDSKIQQMERRVKILERNLEERDKAHQSLIETYEGRIQKLRSEVDHEKKEKFAVLGDLNQLKEKYYQEVSEGHESRYEDILRQKSILQVKLDKMGAELDSYKLRLIENEIKAKRETLERLEISNAKRIKTKFKRMIFVGEPKTFQEILNMMNQMDQYALKSKERLASLEEFCIYANSSFENLEKLRTLGVARHAAKSLASTDASIVIRAICLATILTKDNQKVCEALIELGAISYIVEYLNSSNENFRVESLTLLEQISQFSAASALFSKFSILTRIIILLEEGLQMRQDYGTEQAISCMKIIQNYVLLNVSATQQLHVQGGVQSLAKCLFAQDQIVRRVAIEILAVLKLTDEIIFELSNLGMISVIVKLMFGSDYYTTLNASKLFRNLTKKESILKLIMQYEDVEILIDSMTTASTKEVKSVQIEAILNLSAVTEYLPLIVKDQFIKQLIEILATTNYQELLTLSSQLIMVICKNGSFTELVYQQLVLNDIFTIIGKSDIKISNHCFNILKQGFKVPKLKLDLLRKKQLLVDLVVDRLKDHDTDLLDKKQALSLIPYIAIDAEALNLFAQKRLEEWLLNLLKSKNNDKVLNQVLKSLIIIYASTLQAGSEAMIGHQFISKDGLLIILSLLSQKLSDDSLSWKILQRLMQTLFVLCFKEQNLKHMKQENILRVLVDSLIKASEGKQMNVVIQILKLFTFFSDDQTTWSQLIMRDVVKSIFNTVVTKEKLEKKFILGVLYDISTSPITQKIVKEIPWSEGIGRLVNYGYHDEPVCVSIIMANFNKDIVIRNQIITMLPKEQIQEILQRRHGVEIWIDPAIPSHIKRQDKDYGRPLSSTSKALRDTFTNILHAPENPPQKPPSQQTQRSGITQHGMMPRGRIDNPPQIIDKAAYAPVGLTSQNLLRLNQPRQDLPHGNTRQNFVKSFLNQIDANNEKLKPQNRMRAGSNLRSGGHPGMVHGLNQLDNNLDLAPFDSVSNPNRTRRFDSSGRVGAAMEANKGLHGGGMKPELDSFYKDREEIKQRQLQMMGK